MLLLKLLLLEILAIMMKKNSVIIFKNLFYSYGHKNVMSRNEVNQAKQENQNHVCSNEVPFYSRQSCMGLPCRKHLWFIMLFTLVFLIESVSGKFYVF